MLLRVTLILLAIILALPFIYTNATDETLSVPGESAQSAIINQYLQDPVTTGIMLVIGIVLLVVSFFVGRPRQDEDEQQTRSLVTEMADEERAETAASTTETTTDAETETIAEVEPVEPPEPPEERDPLLLIERGIAAVKADHKDEGERLLRKAIDKDETPDDLKSVAYTWLAETTDNMQDRLLRYREALNLNPRNDEARLRMVAVLNEDLPPVPDSLASVIARKAGLDAETLQQMSEKTSGELKAVRYMERGIAAVKAGNNVEAARLLRNAVKREALSDDLRSLAYLWLAETSSDNQHKHYYYNKSLKADPTNEDARNRLLALLTVQVRRETSPAPPYLITADTAATVDAPGLPQPPAQLPDPYQGSPAAAANDELAAVQGVERGIAAVRAGNLSEGAGLLSRSAQSGQLPNTIAAVAQIWLAETSDDTQFKIAAYNEALRLDPQNAQARERLSSILAAQLPATPPPAPNPSPDMPYAPETGGSGVPEGLDINHVDADDEEAIFAIDETPEPVAFAVHYTREVPPEVWQPLVAYIYRDSAAAVVNQDSEEQLRNLTLNMSRTEIDEQLLIPDGTRVTANPLIDGFQFNPPSATAAFFEDWQRFEFKLRAVDAPIGQTASGRITFTVEGLIVAEIPLEVYVGHTVIAAIAEKARAKADPFDLVFPAYNPADQVITDKLEQVYMTLGLDYLRDVLAAQRDGVWNDRVRELIGQADVFQLYWSQNAAQSEAVRQAWTYALSLTGKPANFVRPVFWEQPYPAIPDRLKAFQFSYMTALSK